MKAGFINLVTRDGSNSSTTYNPTMATLLIVLVVLLIVALLSLMALYYMRYRRRKQQEQGLPLYAEKAPITRSNHRRIMARPSQSLHVYQETQNLIVNSSSPPSTAVPEIRITFPEELDEGGKRQSGRVVVVHVGETCVAMEPFSEKLPSYQQTESDRFQSLDLDRIGGLKEKGLEERWQ